MKCSGALLLMQWQLQTVTWKIKSVLNANWPRFCSDWSQDSSTEEAQFFPFLQAVWSVEIPGQSVSWVLFLGFLRRCWLFMGGSLNFSLPHFPHIRGYQCMQRTVAKMGIFISVFNAFASYLINKPDWSLIRMLFIAFEWTWTFCHNALNGLWTRTFCHSAWRCHHFCLLADGKPPAGNIWAS